MPRRVPQSYTLWVVMVVVVILTRSNLVLKKKEQIIFGHAPKQLRKQVELKSTLTLLDPAIVTNKKVISYSLFGPNPKSAYSIGIIQNAHLAQKFFPSWTMRVYYGPTVPETVQQELRSLGVELINMANSTIRNKMLWRFLVAGR